MALLAVAALVAGVAVATDEDDPVAGAPTSETATTTPTTTSAPSASFGTTEPGTTTTVVPAERQLPPPPDPGTAGPHEFLLTERDGDPATWDPCDPIEYVVNHRTEPPGAAGLLDEAVRRVEAVTGLDLVDVGDTDEAPPVGHLRPLRDEARYGPGYSPVLIAWSDVEEDPELEEASGLALPLEVSQPGGELQYVTGSIEMNGPYAEGDIADWGTAVTLSTLMHEIGHLLGLDHVDDPTEVMTDSIDFPTEWGPGDLQGLYAAGQGECWPD